MHVFLYTGPLIIGGIEERAFGSINLSLLASTSYGLAANVQKPVFAKKMRILGSTSIFVTPNKSALQSSQNI